MEIGLKEFKELVFELVEGEEPKFIGERPVVIKFGNGHCAPCKLLLPVFESIASDKELEVDFYSVDTDKDPALAGMLGIMGTPSILYITDEGKVEVEVGAKTEKQIRDNITKYFG